jgi:glycosyltransferase involved in cell wall biosynthesis
MRVHNQSAQTSLSSAAAAPRPRVLIVGAHLTNTLGGISTLLNEILRSPLADEFEFRHIASQADRYGRFGKLSKLGLMFSSLARFLWALLRWRPNLVYIHVGGNRSLYRKAPFIALARLARKKVLAHFHAGDFEPYYAKQNGLGRRLIMRSLAQSHRLIAVSEESGRLLQRLLPAAKVAVVPNGVKTAEFAVRREAATDHFVRLLFVGAMGRLKGEADLIGALQRVAGAAPEFRLAMLGHGSATVAPLCQQSGLLPHIDHLGPVPMSERMAFFRWADVFVLPTYAEGMPLSVIEAMAAGLPVITTAVGGIPELIEDGVEGFLIKPGDVEALADRLLRLVRDPQLCQRMGERSRAKAQQFDLEVIIARLRTELDQTIGQAIEFETIAPGAQEMLQLRQAAEK